MVEGQALSAEALSFYRELIDNLPEVIFQLDEKHNFIFVNEAVKIWGYSVESLLGKPLLNLIWPADRELLDFVKNSKLELENSFNEDLFYLDQIKPQAETWEVRIILADQHDGQVLSEEINYIHAELSLRPLIQEREAPKKICTGSIGIIRDIGQRKRAEDFLRKLLWAVDQTPVSIIIADAEGRIEYVNPYFIRTTGFTPAEVIGKKVSVLKSNYHPAEFYEDIKQTLKKCGEWSGELINRRKNGSSYWCQVLISVVRNPQGLISNYISIQEDITERKRTAKQLKSLQEKELLLREIHHRVKNNLQIITSLLSLQRNSLTDDRFCAIFQKCENRIKTIALIHEKLYQSQELAKIEFDEYLKALLFYLRQANRERFSCLNLQIETQKVYLDISLAIPLGLIVNELVTNSLLHAFEPGEKGFIQVNLFCEKDLCILEVSDNGKGVKNAKELFSCQKNKGLGLQLIKVLTHQLQASLKIIVTKGLLFRVSFRLPN